jgi:hypothetical protein
VAINQLAGSRAVTGIAPNTTDPCRSLPGSVEVIDDRYRVMAAEHATGP